MLSSHTKKETNDDSRHRGNGLTKRFGDTLALDHVDLPVDQGTVLGLLGPNGAGKTTAVRILATLLRADSGTARVSGSRRTQGRHRVRQTIGLTGQYASVDEDLTGTQNLVLIGQLLNLSSRDARRRAAELLEWFDLTDAAGRVAKTYSGGMRRRLDLAAGLVGRPSVIFLDEPTTGLDPAKREDMWEVVRRLVGDGATVLLTTQYLEEADALADEITVIDHGRVIANDTPDGLEAGRRRTSASPSGRRTRVGVRTCAGSCSPCPASEPEVSGRGRMTVPVDSEAALSETVTRSRGADLRDRAFPAPSEPRRGLLLPHRQGPPTAHSQEDAA